MILLLFNLIPKLALLIAAPGTLLALVGGVLLIIAGQWALGIVLLVIAAGLGFLSFKFWQLQQPAS